jgi:hypothetical protein
VPFARFPRQGCTQIESCYHVASSLRFCMLLRCGILWWSRGSPSLLGWYLWSVLLIKFPTNYLRSSDYVFTDVFDSSLLVRSEMLIRCCKQSVECWLVHSMNLILPYILEEYSMRNLFSRIFFVAGALVSLLFSVPGTYLVIWYVWCMGCS